MNFAEQRKQRDIKGVALGAQEREQCPKASVYPNSAPQQLEPSYTGTDGCPCQVKM